MSKNSFSIRPATASDTDAIVAMWQIMGDQHLAYDRLRWRMKTDAASIWRKYFLKQLTKKDSFALVAVNGTGQPVGYLLANIGPPPPIMAVRSRGEIDDVFVRKEYRRHGLGRKLMIHAVKIMKARGAEYVSLFVAASNRSAVRFYKNLGMKPLVQQMCQEL